MTKCVFKWVEKYSDLWIPPLGNHGDYYSDFNIYLCEKCGKIRVDAEQLKEELTK